MANNIKYDFSAGKLANMQSSLFDIISLKNEISIYIHELNIENDEGKLVYKMLKDDDGLVVATIADDTSQHIIGAIGEFISNNNCTLNTSTYCKNNQYLKIGALIKQCPKIPFYAESQIDNLVKSETLGKIIEIIPSKFKEITPSSPEQIRRVSSSTSHSRPPQPIRTNSRPSMIQRPQINRIQIPTSRIVNPLKEKYVFVKYVPIFGQII